MKNTSTLSVSDVLSKCWENFAPVKFVINKVVVWDDYKCNFSPFEVVETVINNDAYKKMFVKNVKIKIVDFHHSEIYIRTV